MFQITFKTSTQTKKTQYPDDRKADEHAQCWVFFVTEILSYLLIIQRRSRYVTLPLKQNFWVSTNRGPSDMPGKKNEWLCSGTMQMAVSVNKDCWDLEILLPSWWQCDVPFILTWSKYDSVLLIWYPFLLLKFARVPAAMLGCEINGNDLFLFEQFGTRTSGRCRCREV